MIISESKIKFSLRSGEEKRVDTLSIGDEVKCFLLEDGKMKEDFIIIKKIKTFKFVSTKLNPIYSFLEVRLSPLHNIVEDNEEKRCFSSSRFEKEIGMMGKKVVSYSLETGRECFFEYSGIFVSFI